ncbi:MAG: hypothetical protein K2N95_14705 [Lachnospiraceae bacterium]|nr:hypothetical protein [Lachnospiraceae bacterium]
MIVTDLLQFLFHFILVGFPTSLRQVWRPWEQVFQKISGAVYGAVAYRLGLYDGIRLTEELKEIK